MQTTLIRNLTIEYVSQDVIKNRLCRNEIKEITDMQDLGQKYKMETNSTQGGLWSDKMALMDLINLLYKK